MTSFGALERSIARLFDNMPFARATAKKLYQRVNYAIKREKGFAFCLESDSVLTTPAKLAGVGEPDAGVSEFFGYFNISPWSPNQRYFITHRFIKYAGAVDVGIYDLAEGGYQRLGSSPAWTLQQGTLAQWIKSGPFIGQLAYNTVVDGVLGVRLLNPETLQDRFLSHPIQDIAGDTCRAAGINPLRLAAIGSDYGYRIEVDNLMPNLSVDDDGLWLIDLETGERSLTVTLADVISSAPSEEMHNASRQEFNHVQFAPSGASLVFMHRWYNGKGRRSALIYLDLATGNYRRVLETGMVSHYAWLDDARLVLWCRSQDGDDHYSVLYVTTGRLEKIGPAEAGVFGDGHPSPGGSFGEVLTDSYPDRARQQHLFAFDKGLNGSRRTIGRFLLPLGFAGPRRVDLHPRLSPDGSMISFDSGHTGMRRTYILQQETTKDN